MRKYDIAQGTLLNVFWWPEWEESPQRMKYMYMYGWFTLLCSLNYTTLKSNYLLLFSHVWLFETPRTAAYQAFLSYTIFQNWLKLMSIESAMPSNQAYFHFPEWIKIPCRISYWAWGSCSEGQKPLGNECAYRAPYHQRESVSLSL